MKSSRWQLSKGIDSATLVPTGFLGAKMLEGTTDAPRQQVHPTHLSSSRPTARSRAGGTLAQIARREAQTADLNLGSAEAGLHPSWTHGRVRKPLRSPCAAGFCPRPSGRASVGGGYVKRVWRARAPRQRPPRDDRCSTSCWPAPTRLSAVCRASGPTSYGHSIRAPRGREVHLGSRRARHQDRPRVRTERGLGIKEREFHDPHGRRL